MSNSFILSIDTLSSIQVQMSYSTHDLLDFILIRLVNFLELIMLQRGRERRCVLRFLFMKQEFSPLKSLSFGKKQISSFIQI